MNAEYLAFLDRRIPELHKMGKPVDEKSTTAGAIERNLKASRYPGRKARDQADVEWAQILRTRT